MRACVRCRVGSSERLESALAQGGKVRCRVGSSENISAHYFVDAGVRCRVGSSEMSDRINAATPAVRCHVGSSEIASRGVQDGPAIRCRVGSSENGERPAPSPGYNTRPHRLSFRPRTATRHHPSRARSTRLPSKNAQNRPSCPALRASALRSSADTVCCVTPSRKVMSVCVRRAFFRTALTVGGSCAVVRKGEFTHALSLADGRRSRYALNAVI